MNTRQFALVAGIVYLLVAIAGFLPDLMRPLTADSPPTHLHLLEGRLFGYFPVNIAHTLVHLGIGLWGTIAARSDRGAVTYARSLAVIYAVLAIMGLFPTLNVAFGLLPLYSHDIWLHAGTALVAGYFGYYADTRMRV